MFKLFYKYTSTFYLNVEIYNDLLNSNININKKNLQLYFIAKLNMSIKFKLKLHSVTERFHYIEFFTDCKKNKDLMEVFFKSKKELLAPWIIFPNYIESYLSWDQGIQYDYCIKHWMPYWKSLDTVSKESYLQKYNCNSAWIEWLVNNENSF